MKKQLFSEILPWISMKTFNREIKTLFPVYVSKKKLKHFLKFYVKIFTNFLRNFMKTFFHEIPGGTSRNFHGFFRAWNYLNNLSELLAREPKYLVEFFRSKFSLKTSNHSYPSLLRESCFKYNNEKLHNNQNNLNHTY